MLETVYRPSREERDRAEKELWRNRAHLKATLELDGKTYTFEDEVPKVVAREAFDELYERVHDWFKEGEMWEAIRSAFDKAVDSIMETGQPKEGYRSAVAVYHMYPDGTGSLVETYYLTDTEYGDLDDRLKDWLQGSDMRACRVGDEWEKGEE